MLLLVSLVCFRFFANIWAADHNLDYITFYCRGDALLTFGVASFLASIGVFPWRVVWKWFHNSRSAI